MSRNHHESALTAGQTVIVLSMAAWPVIAASAKRIVRYRKNKKGKQP